MGQVWGATTARSGEDLRVPTDPRWPVIGPDPNQLKLLFVKGMPEFVEESSVAPHRAFSVRGSDKDLFWAYWNAFCRDYGAYIEVLGDGPVLLRDRELSVVFRMKPEFAPHAAKWFKY